MFFQMKRIRARQLIYWAILIGNACLESSEETEGYPESMGEVSGEAIVPSDHALICKKEVVERFKDSVPVDQEVPPPFREGDEGHGYQGGTEQYQDPVAGREDPLVDQEKGQVTANHTSRQLEQDPVARINIIKKSRPIASCFTNNGRTNISSRRRR